MVRLGNDRAELVLQLVLELDSCRLHVIGEEVVKFLPLLCEVVALKHAQAPDLVEADQAALVKRDQQLATGP